MTARAVLHPPFSPDDHKQMNSARTADIALDWFDWDQSANAHVFNPFYDEAYALTLPAFDTEWPDAWPTPSYLDEPENRKYNPGKYTAKGWDMGRDISYIYYLMCAGTGLIKIGHAARLSQRISAHRSSSSFPLLLVGKHYGTREYEKLLHKHFAPIRHHGEWFWPHEKLCWWIHREVYNAT